MNSQKLKLCLIALCLGSYVFGQNATNEFPLSFEKEIGIHKHVQQRTDDIFDSLVKIRRDFHRYPEVSEQEKRTSEKVAAYLISLGLEVKTDIGGYGVVGILNGNKKGKRIAWRADIDAVASDLPDVVDFPSKNEGVRHICGHDVHTTIGMGIANVLASQKENFQGTIYFIFQPSEEKAIGAKMMMADGLFDIIKPDEIYALHMSPYPVGTIATKSVNVFSHITAIEVEYEASVSQGSLINFTKELIKNTQTHGPNSKFWDFSNVFNPEIGVTNTNTIYKDYVALVSDFDIKESGDRLKIRVGITGSHIGKLDTFLASIRNKIETSKYSEELLSVKFLFQEDMSVMFTPMNNKKLTNETMKSISNLYGKQSVIPLYGVAPYLFSDDFAYFQKSVQGVYFFLGGSNYEKEIVAMPHTPIFAIDEESIRTGVNYFSSMIIERLMN
jgi:metal-dependent amidase/aminoacylase/carboxypeptidase family protein